jgi:lipopolysaccharide export LptBFGC system permease protein LptF
MALLLLGIPVVMRRAGTNVFASVGICIVVVLLFTVVVLGCQGLGANYLLTPVMAAWCPVLMFVPAAAALSAGWWY